MSFDWLSFFSHSGRSISPDIAACGTPLAASGRRERTENANSGFTGIGVSRPSCSGDFFFDSSLVARPSRRSTLKRPACVAVLKAATLGAFAGGDCGHAELLLEELGDRWRWQRVAIVPELDFEADQREVDHRDAAERRRPDLELDADLVASHELEPDDDAHPRPERERIPRDEHVDVDIESGADVAEFRRERDCGARHDRLRRAGEEDLDRQLDEAEDRGLHADTLERRVVLRHLEDTGDIRRSTG